MSDVKTEIQFPQVNFNGSSKEALMKQNLKVLKAAKQLLEAMCEASPHGRDYQTLPIEAYRLARSQHEARQQMVISIRDEIEAIAFAISKQG